jgi:DNA polymerase III gamma/tau subunit
MSLANDYRPTEWEDITEQGLTVKILKNICDSGELSCRNFLLTGPAGTG